MSSCGVVALLTLLALILVYESSARQEVTGQQLRDNVNEWSKLRRLVSQDLQKREGKSHVNPFDGLDFLSRDFQEGTAVQLAAKNVVPDFNLTRHFMVREEKDPCRRYLPPDGFKREPVPLFTIAVMKLTLSEPTRNSTPNANKFLPYICALRQQTAMILFLNISRSLVAPPKGDLCGTMTLIRQTFHSRRFLATIFTERTDRHKAPLCRPIVWGNLSPYLQIRKDIRETENAETLVFLGSKGGSINFALHLNLHKLSPVDQKRMIQLSNLYVTMDNTCQLAYRSSLVRENYITGPRFAFPVGDSMKKGYERKRKDLRDHLVKEGRDLSPILMLQIIPVLLFAAIITMFIAVNPQYILNTYTRVTEIIEEEEEDEPKGGVLDHIKNAVIPRKKDSDSNSKGRRVRKTKKAKRNTGNGEISAVEVTAEGELTATAMTEGQHSMKDDEKTKKKKGGMGSITGSKTKKAKKYQKKTQEKTSDNELTAETGGTTIGTEATAAATMTATATASN